MKTILDDRITDKLHSLFPALYSVELFDETPPYKRRFLSVFDHWLSDEEATDENAFNDVLLGEYRNRLCKFYKFLYASFDIYCFFETNAGGASVLAFSSEEEFLSWVEINLQERIFLRLLVPEMKIILDGGYDYTHTLFLAEGADLGTIEKIVNDHGLFILD